MVDLDDLDGMKEDSSEDSGSSSTSASSSQSGGSSGSVSGDSPGDGASSGAFSMDSDDMVDPSGKSVSKVSKEWADDGGELNYQKESGEGLKSYMSRQVREVEELHDNMVEMANNNMDNFDEFTLFMHAMFLNFAQNRVGIINTIENQFGKDRREAYKITNKICEKAGEKDLMEQMVRDMTENLAEL